jgi:serine protease DegQ
VKVAARPRAPRRARARARRHRASRGGAGWAVATLLSAATLLAACRRGSDGASIGRPDVAALIDAALPAVVRVRGRGGMAQTEGSGFFIRGDAGQPLVVTNHHVVWGAAEIAIERQDGVTETAALVGVDDTTDLALLRPSSRSAPATLSFGDDSGLRVGGWVLALGSPDGLFNAASTGVLSARALVPGAKLPAERLVDHLFIDAALGAGSSGGPVLDLGGRVVGVSLAILGGSRGLGVLLPSGLAARVVRDLEREGRSAHGFAGVALADEVDAGRSSGSVRVTAVVPGGPADQAHLRTGDRILALDGARLRGAADLRRRLFTTPPGGLARLDLARTTERIEATLRLQPLPAPGRPWPSP